MKLEIEFESTFELKQKLAELNELINSDDLAYEKGKVVSDVYNIVRSELKYGDKEPEKLIATLEKVRELTFVY